MEKVVMQEYIICLYKYTSTVAFLDCKYSDPECDKLNCFHLIYWYLVGSIGLQLIQLYGGDQDQIHSQNFGFKNTNTEPLGHCSTRMCF